MIKYIRTLAGVLMLSGVLLLVLSGLWDWHSLVANIGLALTSAGVTTFLIRYDISEATSTNLTRNVGIAAVGHGRSAMLEGIGPIDSLLRRSRPKFRFASDAISLI